MENIELDGEEITGMINDKVYTEVPLELDWYSPINETKLYDVDDDKLDEYGLEV